MRSLGKQASHLQELDVDTARYADLSYSRTQQIGDAAYFLGFDSMVVPSARFSCSNLVLFSERIEPADLESDHSEIVDWKTAV
jgi:hypothetical protein